MGFSTKDMVVRVEAPSMEAEEEERNRGVAALNEAKAMRVVAAPDEADADFEPYDCPELRSAKEGLARSRTKLARALEAAARGMDKLSLRVRRREVYKYAVGILGEQQRRMGSYIGLMQQKHLTF